MAEGIEKRKAPRLPLRLFVSCRTVGAVRPEVMTGRTVNIGAGGLYFEGADAGIMRGDLTQIRLSIPPTAGLLELGGIISTHARVLRIDELPGSCSHSKESLLKGVAVQFCQPPKLRL